MKQQRKKAEKFYVSFICFACFHCGQTLTGVTTGDMNLIAIDQTGEDEVDKGVKPQQLILGQHIAQGAAHLVDAHIAADAEGGGK